MMKTRFGNVTAFLNFVEVKGITDLYWLKTSKTKNKHPSLQQQQWKIQNQNKNRKEKLGN